MRSYTETKIIQGVSDVVRRLMEFPLTHEGLIRAVRVARAEAANTTKFNANNASGTFAYQHGIAALRREFFGGIWQIDESYNLATIRNERQRIKVGFTTVDQACGRIHPNPKSEKGAAAERASGQGCLFDDLKSFAQQPKSPDGYALYYLMVDQSGRAELSRPVIARGGFTAMIERIFILEESEETTPILSLDTDDAIGGFDPQVIRK